MDDDSVEQHDKFRENNAFFGENQMYGVLSFKKHWIRFLWLCDQMIPMNRGFK